VGRELRGVGTRDVHNLGAPSAGSPIGLVLGLAKDGTGGGGVPLDGGNRGDG
jgi:hypothetical protein